MMIIRLQTVAVKGGRQAGIADAGGGVVFEFLSDVNRSSRFVPIGSCRERDAFPEFTDVIITTEEINKLNERCVLFGRVVSFRGK
ncbi:hypothetical protein T4B_494 [Trichinella pseudospiralis]|uniref:Uncharacterized protein n=2 Tax=Trichinella pseudospiralis TaxID=6337 RepID=A0A0V1ELV7_TRIPS|nr:hypothetical protein T4A_4763 [Trichinella pseudospiralis]KRZ35134.1 hypothetical protein T4B_494 [Trichinella pseudospiralis]